MDNSCISIMARIIKNFFLTLRTKGIIALILGIKNYIKIVVDKKFFPSSFIKKKIFNYEMYLDPKDKGISRTLILFGHRELDHKKILELVLKKNMKIFDIGANIGYYVLIESNLVGNKGKILAIEPVPENMKLLKKNLKLNNNRITKTIQAAVSGFSKKDSFIQSSHSNLGHLVSDKYESLIDISKKLKHKDTKELAPKIMYISELISKTFYPDFIRMDVEGSELGILNHLVSLKLKKYPIICFETHTSSYSLSHKMAKRDSNISQMEDVLRKMFAKGYKIKLASSSSERGSNLLRNLGYHPAIKDIKTDDVKREIYKNLKEKDAINLICYKGGLRTVLMSCNK